MLLALKVAPQRSTLYAGLARTLAEPELMASPLGGRVQSCEPVRLAGQDYLLVDLAGEPDAADLDVLSRLGATSEVHEYFPAIGDVPGPLLRPVEPTWAPFVPPEIVEARRYRGKTNELFTTVLLNLALFAGDFAAEPAARLRVLDPLAGGGTTLFTALVRGYDAAGIEREREDVESTDAYVRQFLRGAGVRFKRVAERLRGIGRRTVYTIGRGDDTRLLALALGDTFAAPELLGGLPGGARFHAVVADLPYGIQHRGQVEDLLADALPAWAALLLPGGAAALAWEASHLTRAEAIDLVEQHPGLRVRDDPPYDALAHAVDRAIKRRDVLVIVKRGP
ncbi:MAG TPA: hypothetical protein VFL91_31395 [Thermomicrobiales bacterium]|nr:hypothetical protein [Thermomicrobiales bacterium]